MKLIFYVALTAFICSGVQSLEIGNTGEERPMPIDASHISVEFIPWERDPIIELLFPHTKEEIQAMVQVVSKRFRKISTFIGDPSTKVDSLPVESEGPFEAARMNKEANYTHLQISVTFILSPEKLNQQSKDYILDVVSTANQIYSGTVSRVVVYINDINTYYDPFFRSQLTLDNFLQSLRTKLHGQSVKLGVRLWLHDCDPSFAIDTTQFDTYYTAPAYIPQIIFVPSTTTQLLRNVDFVLFYPKTVYTFPDLEDTFETLTKQFSKCEQAVLDLLNKEVSAHLQFSWSSGGGIGAEVDQSTPYNLVKFWKLLGDWGTERKKDVFINGAFDTPISSFVSNNSKDSTEGWWRLADPSAANINMSSFVEKFAEIKNWDLPLPGSAQGLTTSNLVLLGVIVFMLVAIPGVAVGIKFMEKAQERRMFSFNRI